MAGRAAHSGDVADPPMPQRLQVSHHQPHAQFLVADHGVRAGDTVLAPALDDSGDAERLEVPPRFRGDQQPVDLGVEKAVDREMCIRDWCN